MRNPAAVPSLKPGLVVRDAWVLVTPGRPVHVTAPTSILTRPVLCAFGGQTVTGIVKKVAKRGFGIIDGTDGSKIPFILADVAYRRLLKPGQTVLFSVRRVNGTAFAENIYKMPHPVHLPSSLNRVARQNKK